MPFQSPWPDLDIPKCNVLSYVFAGRRATSNKKIWSDAANPNKFVTSAQMLMWVKRFAVGLDKMKVREGGAVMILSPNHIYIPMVYLAAAGSKRCFTGANPVYTVNEVLHQMNTIEADIVLIHPDLLKTGLPAAQKAGISRDRIFLFSDEELAPQQGIKDWRSMCASEREARNWQWDELEGEKSVNTVAAINFSSGTTGLPKGVCITHHNLVANTMQAIYNKFIDTEHSEDSYPDERWVAFLPLYHAYSQLWTINAALRLEVEVYVMANFVFRDYLKHIQEYKATGLQTVPPILVMLAKRPETKDYDISSVKVILCGAAPLSMDLQNEITKRFNLTVCQGWGMSETTCGGIMFPEKYNDATGSIGYLLPNTEARLFDEDDKEVTKEGESGELWIRGPQMLLSYWRNEEATKNSLTSDKWFKTGDVAVTKEGKWWIVDRRKELIKVNGLQVAPAELEAVLLESDDVADAAVTGIMLHGEEYPIAYVVLQDAAKGKVSEKDIQNFVKDKVAKHKQLKGGVKFIDVVPKLSSGKIVRKLLREWAKRDQKEQEGTIKARL